MLPCFLIILEQIINALFQAIFLSRTNTRLNMLLCNWLVNSWCFEYNKNTLAVFINLSKAFDKVNFSALFKKLEIHDITDWKHSWIKAYLSNKKQFIQIGKYRTRNNYMWCSARFNTRATTISTVCKLTSERIKFIWSDHVFRWY